ncbi:hypothetical protein [Luteimicrobium sp. DT211]|uniref:hypothetical protein n=1 Tax=Luteimicrobium sp. DT211 TaxID=3393412 RepID=UPI003CF1406F
MTTFDLTPDGSAVGPIAPPRAAPARATRATTTSRTRRRWFRGHSLWLQAVVFTLALVAGLFTGYLINR